MKTKKAVNKALGKLQEAIDILEEVSGINTEIDEAAEAIGFAYADLEYANR